MEEMITQEKYDTSTAAKLQRVEALSDELKQLLERNNSAFDDDSIRSQIDLLEHWLDCHRCGVVATDMFSKAAANLVGNLRCRLKLASEEMQRLEGEGGSPATKEQATQAEDMVKAIRRSEKLLANIEELFPNDQPHNI